MLPLKAKTVNNIPTLILSPKGQISNNALEASAFSCTCEAETTGDGWT